MNSLLKEERQRLILEVLQENKKVAVQELSRRFGTSEVTIRRDLQEMASDGMLRRAHRGAILVNPAPPEPPVMHRMALDQHEKEAIARAAAELVGDGEAIFVGSGSTTAYLARHLAGRKHLTVVTNALNIAADLALANETITTVVTGGVVRPDELSLLGHIVELTLPEVRVEKVFMGMQAISIEGGLTTDHLPEVAIARKIFEMAPELIVLADHSKLNHMAAAYIAPVTRMTTLITSAGANGQFLTQLEQLGIHVIQAEV